MAKLGDYIRIKHGYAFKGDSITTEDNGVVLVTPGNFEIGGGFKEKKCKYYSSDYPSEYVLQAGDLIVTMTDLSKGGDTLGYSAIVPKSARIYLHNQRIGLVDVFNPEADKQYIYWLMRTHIYQKTIVATASGSTVKHTSPSRICEVNVELPSIDKQRKIAATLNAIEHCIVVNNQINDNLEQQARTIFKSWFVDFEPFGGVMPKDWQVAKLGDIASITNGKRPPMKTAEKTSEAYIPLVGAASIMGYTNTALYNAPILVTGRVGTHGIVQRFQLPCWPSDNTLVITSQYYEFIYQVLQTVDYKNMNRGSTQPLITQKDLKNIEIVLPPFALLEQFESLVGVLMQSWETNRNENKRLSALRNILLPKLMSGEIDVSAVQL